MMSTPGSVKNTRTVSARVAIGAAAATLVLLAGLHLLSPEFDPSLNVLSEYAKGRYGSVLSLLFLSWGISSWALVVALWSELKRIGGRIGLGFLIVAGLGQAMASLFDINHPLVHLLVGILGILGLPTAAMLISVRLGRTPNWRSSRNLLLGTANLTWISLVLMFAGLFIMVRGYTLAGHKIVFVGWANRLVVVSHCVWTITVASLAIKRSREARSGGE